MKICICSEGYPSTGLQLSSFIQVLAKEMVRQGCDICVVAPQSLTNYFFRGGILAPCYFEDCVNVGGAKRIIKIYRPYTLSLGAGILGRLNPWFYRMAVEYTIWRHRLIPDVFYAHFWANAYNVFRCAAHYQKPLFVATGEDEIKLSRYISKRNIRKIRDLVKGVICVSSKNKDESVKLGFANNDDCIVLANAIDPMEFYLMDQKDARKKMGFNADDFIVAYCGRFNNRKGAIRVSEAIKKINDPSIKSIFIGTLSDNEKAEPDCNGIIFKGNLQHCDIVSYLNCADVFVLPSLAEGCPNSVIEAMACGLPIISSDLPFNYDILDKNNSILIDPNNIDEISSAILQIKQNVLLKSELSKYSLATAKKLTIDKRVHKILDFISERIVK